MNLWSVGTLTRPVVLPLFSSLITLGGAACITPQGTLVATCPTTTPSPTPSATTSSLAASVGARAARIIFQSSSSGSFTAPSDSSGTIPGLGTGYSAVRVFDATNTLIADGGSSSSAWPKWLQKFEISLGGSSNVPSGGGTALPSACARFAAATESTTGACQLGNSSLSNCGASSGVFRISEADCKTSGVGKGSNSDQIYLRAQFDRSQLESSENLLAVLDYAVAGLNPGPNSPVACISGSGTSPFGPEPCADFTWRTFLRTSSDTDVQPFLLLVPPMVSTVLINPRPGASPTPTPYPGGASTTLTSKQMILPLAANPTFSVFQISRTGANSTAQYLSKLNTYCNPNSNPEANSPLCAGIVFYAITFYRI